ncbi:hypothetical protein HDU76_000511 [Blyttiomyces sp. JEL0837]|nr:hypothetical protein HDU76_000511 [Blyttiomyces sp. JEL0837]
MPTYAQIKIFQLGGLGDNCAMQLQATSFTYFGACALQYVFAIFRYLEVHGKRMQRYVIPAAVLTFIFTASIPINIALDVAHVSPEGACQNVRPPISYYFPMVTDVLLVTYLTILFTEPLFKAANFTADSTLKSKAITILVTNSIAMGSTLIFHITLATPVTLYGPITSSLNLMIVCTCSCLPYFMFGNQPPTGTPAVTSRAGSSGHIKKGSLSVPADEIDLEGSHQTLHIVARGLSAEDMT